MTSNTSAITRQLQIDLITDNPNPLKDWFESIWSSLYVVETNVYQDDYYQSFWGEHASYWLILQNKIQAKFTILQDITKILFDHAMNTNIPLPGVRYRYDAKCVNKVLNSNIALPGYPINIVLVNKALDAHFK